MAMFKKRLHRLETLVKQAEEAAQAPMPRSLQSAQDVMDVLQEQVEALRSARWCGVVPKARAVGYLAGIARKAIETNLLATSIKEGQSKSGAGPSSPPFKIYMGFDPKIAYEPSPASPKEAEPNDSALLLKRTRPCPSAGSLAG